MKKLWLTYAWKDNEGADVDFVIQELQRIGVDVRYDRTDLVAGQRIWEQIDKAIGEGCDAWALYATESSLQSQPCQEEIAYALDRALREGPANFPLVGIFPTKLDRSLLPSALATRLYVNLKDKDWASRIAGALEGTSGAAPTAEVPRFIAKVHSKSGEDPIVEMRPRAGFWLPFFIATEKAREGQILKGWYGPPGRPEYQPPMISSAPLGEGVEFDGRQVVGLILNHEITPTMSAYARLKPGTYCFGEAQDGEVHSITVTLELTPHRAD